MKKAVIFYVFALIFQISFGQQVPEKQLDSLFSALYNKKMFNGNVLIAEKGNVVFQKSYEIANEETGQKLDENSIFELASVSKQFTAMGIVLLEKQGKLRYDDLISKFIPELNSYGNITIRQLLTHTSGLPDYMELFDEKWDKTKFATNKDIVEELAKYKPSVEFSPGEKFEYSNTGYALLALIIERVSGQSFGEFLKDNIFTPLDMQNTFVYRSRFEPKKIENYAKGYMIDSLGDKINPDSMGKNYLSYYLDGIVGDGMVNSTTNDLLKWDRALYGNELVDNKDKQIIFSSVKTPDGKESNYGFGWAVGNSEKYGKVVNHSRGWAGYYTFIERHLDNKKTIIILQNNMGDLTTMPLKEIRKILYNEPLFSDGLFPTTLNPDELQKYTGTYINSEMPLTIHIFIKENILMGQSEGQSAFPLDSYENNTFKYEMADIKIVFDLNENSFDFYQGKTHLIFKRQE
ncbi:class A beta-lactamase-related serine hydrolase [Aequorivita sp. H23M31]|uniref:Class A beta-lactamase-related serine hydrolase n=1 Tax=Aequorivita ciconiae TaxID=2494375 RepID=A0A410G0B5_9FLAO|nr:serine hydrolase domain-containing protein [Aequorivita sp. H23M31]QAA80728.1 class A beta-lactamase-related serine hydrolase [Aequorivita sp. H23M31]